MRRRGLVVVGGLTALTVVLLGAGVAWGDALSNIGPAPQVFGGLFGAYPLGDYALDSHFSAVSVGVFSGVNVSGVPPMIAFFLANTIWQLTALIANCLITVFTWAFSLNLLTGSAQTGGAGALAPVSTAMQSIYGSVLGAPWLTVAIVFAGGWAMWKALVQRRYAETAGSLATSLIYVLIALFIVTQPQRTIGTASRWTNEMSGAFLSLTDRGTLDSAQQAKQADADQLFKTLVYEPWVVLEFGGIEHCTTAGTSTSAPVQPLPAPVARQLQAGTEVQVGDRTCINDANKYARHFLRYPPGSADRNREYAALAHGDAGWLPSSDPSKASGGYRLGAADEPAAEAMGEGGQYERLLLALVIGAGELGAFLLLGALSVGVVIAQIVVLVLLAFAPVVLVIAVYPGRGHALFISWLQRLAAFLVRKAIYGLILAVLLAVSQALIGATASLGWLLSFLLQAAFFWTVFLYRRHLTGQLSTVVTGHDPRHGPAVDLAGLYLAQRLWRSSRGHNGTPPPASGSGPTGPQERPPGGGPTGPVGDPDPPASPPAGEGWAVDAINERAALSTAARVETEERVAQLPGRPQLALPPPALDPPEEPGGPPAGPDQRSRSERPDTQRPDAPNPVIEPDATVQPDRPVPETAPRPEAPPAAVIAGSPDVGPRDRSADAPTEAVPDDGHQSGGLGDQEPSLADQLRADAERLDDNPPSPALSEVSEDHS